jgi:putative heme iron utilization protein
MSGQPQMAKPAFDPVAESRRLLQTSRYGALATKDRATGHPYASLVALAPDADGAPLILISTLALHTTNLMADSACSLLLADIGEGDPSAHPRLSLMGQARKMDAGAVRERYLSAQPDSALYADFADFSFWRIEALGGHLVAGFGRIVDLTPAQLLNPSI